MAQTYVKVFHDWHEITTELNDDEKGRLIDAMIAYARGESYQLTGNERFVFPSFKAQIDRDAAAYEDICEKRKQAGAKGGKQKQANASTGYQEPAKRSKSSQDKDKDKDEDKYKDLGYNTHVLESPPTPDEVQQFMSECPSGKSVDVTRSAERFWNYHQAMGWKMQEWKPLARNWIEEDTQRPRTAQQTNPALAYDQRSDTDYSGRIINLEEYGSDEQQT